MRARLVPAWLSLALAFFGATAIANAHPLGNFTINHLAEVTPERGAIRVRYVLDIAEIPTFQIMRASSPGAAWSSDQLKHWGDEEAAVVADGVELRVDGTSFGLALQRATAQLRPGAGGLPTLYWVGDFAARVSAQPHHISLDDRVYGDRRIGWKDVIVAPQSEPTSELLHYPSALIGSPRRVSGVTFQMSEDGSAGAIVAIEDSSPDSGSSNSIVRSSALSDMFSSSNRTPIFIVLTMLVAFGLGALHAIEPGHGKALLAFTLVGSRATVKQAAILAASLTFAHTIGVLILGAVLFFAASFVSETIYPWITLFSGMAVAVIGARNVNRYARASQVHVHDHGDGHAHSHDGSPHAHDHDAHGHSHAVPGEGPIDFRAAVVAAMSGGIAPCPAAIVVMLAALRLHQVGYGMVLIVIFSLGLAAVLTGLGIAVVHGSALITRSHKFERLVAAGPLMSAALISVVGAVMIGQGFAGQGAHAPVWAIAGAVVAAIAGYGLLPRAIRAYHFLPQRLRQTSPLARSRANRDSLMEQQP